MADLGSLEDALPGVDAASKGATAGERSSGKVKHKSLKSRPGAMKRKEKLMTAERERFAKNLALMAAGSNEAVKVVDTSKPQEGKYSSTDGAPPSIPGGAEALSASRAKWAAIRDHIGRTMETMDRSASRGLNHTDS